MGQERENAAGKAQSDGWPSLGGASRQLLLAHPCALRSDERKLVRCLRLEAARRAA